ncbi:hypothetical protein KG090_02145 [Carnobacteriaceae bacterium zg-ZUI240]|nr:hypothetical protein [Carnobacteriaceae bacterium zg-ZUI240]
MNNRYHSNWIKLVIGLLSLGIAQSVLFKGLITPVVTQTEVSISIIVVGIVLFMVGTLIILPMTLQFYRNYKRDKRLIKVSLLYILGSLSFGIVIGMLGECLYHFSDLTYQEVKNGMWLMTNISQSGLRMGVVFCLMCIYRKQSIKKYIKSILPMLSILSGLSSIPQIISLWKFPLNPVVFSVVDITLLLMFLYYLNHQTDKEITNDII